MFDLEYNANVGFVPYVSVMKSENPVSEEEMEKTKQEVKELSESVAEQSSSVAENAGAIADETAAREEADNAINERIDAIPTFKTKMVDKLPAEGEDGTIYLVKDEGKDTYSEYIYADGAWEKLGNDVDLSEYVTKDELESTVAPLAVKSAVDELIDQEAAERAEGDRQNAAAVEAVASGLASEVSARESAVAELREEIVALPKFKILVVDELPGSGESATFYLLATGDEQGNVYDEYIYVNGAWEKIGTQMLDLSDYAKTADVDAAIASVNDGMDTLSGMIETLGYEFESVDEKLAGLAAVNSEQDAEIALKAYAADVAAEIATATGALAEKDIEQDGVINEISSGLTELMDVKADKTELEVAIAGKEGEIYNLTKIVGDLGGAVTYEIPGENGKSFNTLMNNNGTVKLTDDVTTGRFGPGMTAKNIVKLNLNGHDLTVTGLTTSTAQGAIMSRGSQEITIGGKGTVDAGQGICIEANGADSIINLTGSTSVYRTDRSGGELVYCYAGTINITNGTFRNDGDDKKFVLNCYDANYRNGTAKIIVTGGKFYDFDPANNTAEGENTSFVPEGYESVPGTVVEDDVEHTVYTVKKSA